MDGSGKRDVRVSNSGFDFESTSKEHASTHCSNIDTELAIDYSMDFITHEIFQTREALINWAREVGKSQGFMIVIKRSDAPRPGKKGRVFLSCERSGTYRIHSSLKIHGKDKSDKKQSRSTGTKKCSCPFLLKGKELSYEEGWVLLVTCGVHNHLATEHLEGHSFAGRLSEEEENLIVDMSKTLVRPRDILQTLKQKHNLNVSTMRTIYNARRKNKVLEHAGRSQIQQLMNHLSEHAYIEVHRSYPDTDTVKDILWAHPASIELLHAFPQILIIDCTYKTNKYRLPLMEIVGVTSTELTFSVAFAYLEAEREDNFNWCLDSLKSLMHDQLMPSVIVTDRDLALMNAIERIFPLSRHFLCRWHIRKNILTQCRNKFDKKEKFDLFMACWNMMVLAESEDVFTQLLGRLNVDFWEFPQVLAYVKTTWIDKYKERFVACWTDTIMHFGNTTSNRAESAHAKLKRHLGSFLGNFETSWAHIHALLELQHTDIKVSFEKSLNVVLHNFKPAQFKLLHGVVSIGALKKIVEESKRINIIGVDAKACKCILRKTHGLPCAHELAEFARINMLIPLERIDGFWRKLDLSPLVSIDREVVVDLDHRLLEEWELINQRFSNSNDSEKIMMLKRLRELVTPTTSSLIEPPVKIKKCDKRVTKVEVSSLCLPSAHEFVESAEDSCSTPTSRNMIQISTKPWRPKEKVVRARSSLRVDYLQQFPKLMHPFIIHTKDVQSDGNCGYRVIANMLGFGEDGWAQVRRDLLIELNAFPHLYEGVYESSERLEELRHALNHFDGGAAYDKWMVMPDMGYLISSHYNVVLFLLSRPECLTFLPLRTEPLPAAARRYITIGFINNNHFIELHLSNGHPVPPIPYKWHEHRFSKAEGWDAAYEKQMQMYSDLFSSDNSIGCTISID